MLSALLLQWDSSTDKFSRIFTTCVIQTLLTLTNQPTLMARRWSDQWDLAAIRALQPCIARCTRKQIKAVLGHIGRVTSSTASTCWRHFAAMGKTPPPPGTSSHRPCLWSLAKWAPSIGTLAWARITVKHRVPGPPYTCHFFLFCFFIFVLVYSFSSCIILCSMHMFFHNNHWLCDE